MDKANDEDKKMTNEAFYRLASGEECLIYGHDIDDNPYIEYTIKETNSGFYLVIELAPDGTKMNQFSKKTFFEALLFALSGDLGWREAKRTPKEKAQKDLLGYSDYGLCKEWYRVSLLYQQNYEGLSTDDLPFSEWHLLVEAEFRKRKFENPRLLTTMDEIQREHASAWQQTLHG